MTQRLLMAVLLTAAALPASAQEATSQPSLSADQTNAFNAAINDFMAAQKAQQAGDNAGALSGYERALPAIRKVVEVQPDNLANVKFLANVLYVTAIAKASTQSFDAAVPLLEESLPQWRKIVAQEGSDVQSQTVFTNILTQMGNAKLGKQDKAGALPLYAEAIRLARQTLAEKPDNASKNLLLGALIGASQAGDDPAIKSEVAAMSKAMIADGSVDAANKPSAQVLAGAGR
jgi:tetratricopeptide (TPR) repeat protein